ncbi:hypothetical protein BGZ52_007154 [Haplosporangium bisporale]|nr:hypothetical protein BGZ52_007154 [Haplosporangium bisporale]
MSDDDDFMMEEEEDEDYDFDYEDEDGEEPDVDLENKYYNAKGHKEDEPETALIEFQGVVEAETEKGDWGFKSLKQMVKLSFKMGNYDKTLEYYEQLLPYTKTAVTRNYSEKSINNILDFISSSSDMVFMEKFYQTTLLALKDANNDRLLVKTNLKLAKLWLDRKEYGRLSKILRQLHASCQADDGTDDQRKGTHLLEIFALEIQMYTATKNSKKLKALYQQCLSVKSAIPHPRIMGVIRECGGKMHMSEKEWDQAQTDFFESFRNYDEAGSFQRIQVLKYLVLANMLMESQINPFDSQETKPYKNDPQIVAMTNLVSAYQRRDIREFEKILRDNRATIMDDPFIRAYIDDVLKNIRTQVLIRLIKPYTRIEIPFISRQLNIPAQDVEDLLVGLILDKKIAGHIDQVNQRLELQRQTSGTLRYNAMEKWSNNLATMYTANINKIKAQVAKAKAEVLAKAQAMAAARAAAASGSTPIAGASMPAAGVPNMDAIRQRAEALKARMASLSKVPAAGSTAPVPRAAPVPTAPAPADPRARGGLGVDVSSMISRDEAGNLIITAPTGKGAPAFATAKRKKLRRQRRRELLKEKQDKIRLGLLAPDAPKVKLANMMRVLGQEAVLNPTEIEMRVRQQMAERLQTHLDANAERKLTVEERKTKEQKKKEEDLNNGIHVSVYKINDLSHPQKRFKVDTNAQQYGLTGIVLMHPIFSIVVVEGGGKAIRQYKKLMLRRIDWTDNTRLDGTEVSETTDNKCLLVWEGQLRERQFKQLKFIKARTDAHLKETLARFGVQHYWDLALGFKEDEMLGAEAGL